MSKNVCSLSRMEKDNQETSRQSASKLNNNATKRKICPTMRFIRVVPFVNEATRKLMTTKPVYPFSGVQFKW